MDATDGQRIRALFDEYLQMYTSRDDRLTTHFSEDFSGFTGGGDALVKDREAWVAITRQDFAEVKAPIRIELKDLKLQSLAETVAVATGFFTIHLPIHDQILSRETARLVLIFHKEPAGWKISHSSISIPYPLVHEGEVYPLAELQARNQKLEEMIAERTSRLSEVNDELRESESLYRLLTEDVSDVLWKTDARLIITYISPVDERLRGFPAAEVIGHHVFEMFTDDGIATVKELIRQRKDATTITFEAQHRCKDGRLLWAEVQAKPERDAAGNISGYHGITREITERKSMQDEVRRLAFYDPLTKLANRRLLDEHLRQALAASERSGRFGALVFLDLDNFKPLNDAHGHEVGDLLLVEAARRLSACVRASDTVARFGGDEFVVILNGLDPSQASATSKAGTVAKKLGAVLAAPYVLDYRGGDGRDASVTHQCAASIGVAIFLGHAASRDDILRWADTAMYEAKDAGRNQIRFHSA